MAPSKTQSVLSPLRYQKLLGDLQELVETAETSAASEKVHAYWHIGGRIERERIVREAGYHNAVLRDLSRDSRIALRSLQRAVVFRSLYRQPPESNGLTWTHYRELVKVPDPKDRAAFTQLALEQGMTSRELETAIRAGLDAEDHSPNVKRPTDPSYLYGAKVVSVVDGDTIDLLVDLGFHVFREQRIRLAQVDAPELPTAEGRKARDFVFKQLMHVQTIVVRTYRVDLYGRYVGHLFYSSQKVSVAECFETGKHLNAHLVAKGHARVAW